MTTFRDINTYCAYCYLLSRCWGEVGSTPPPGRLESTLSEMTKLMGREARHCSVREARQWLEVLRREPWADCLRDKWDDVLSPFSPRIDAALRGACDGGGSDAARWIEFLGDQARKETRGWIAARLSEDRFVSLPTRLARQAFQVLTSAASESAVLEAEQLRGLASLEANGGVSLWQRPEFRRGLWACLLGRDDRQEKAWACLERVLHGAVGDLKDFERWIEIALHLENLGLRFETGPAAAAPDENDHLEEN